MDCRPMHTQHARETENRAAALGWSARAIHADVQANKIELKLSAAGD